MPLFTRFVEIGRVCLVNSGPDAGKLVAIIDVVDQNRALVDGPNFIRKVVNFKRLNLTKLVVKIQRGMRHKNILKAWQEQGIQEAWEKSAWAKKIAAREAAKKTTDFERFKNMIARKRRNFAINAALSKLVKKK